MRRRDFCFSSALVLAGSGRAAQDQTITIVYPVAGGAWPMFIAKEAGYYKKYGLDVSPALVAYPGGFSMLLHDQAAMVVSGLQQFLPAASKDPSLVAVGCWMNRSTLSLISRSEITTVSDLKRKRIAVGQIGDSLYGYLLTLLAKFGLSNTDVEMTPVGAVPSSRAAALSAGRVDATLLTAPASFRMEDAGYRNLANLADYDDIVTSSGYWVRRSDLVSNAHLVERLIQAHAEAIHRFYTDKSFAIKAYLAFEKQDAADVGLQYNLLVKWNIFERVPYVLKGAVAATLDQPGLGQVKLADFRSAVDNLVIDGLVKKGFFVKLFGRSVESEQKSKASLAFR